jgi:cobalt-zinc-cadmium efflux system outer membrane protein
MLDRTRRTLRALRTISLAVAGLGGIAVAPLAAQRSAAPGVAATSDSSAPLALGAVYRELARASPRIAAARALARAADARVASAGLPPDPQLQFGFMNYSLPGLRPMPVTGMTQLSLMQMLPVAGQLGLASRAAAARAGAARERADDAAWDVRAQGAMAFYDLYRVDRSLAVARATLRLLRDIEGTAQAMYRVGEGRQADVLRAQVEIARMTEDTLRMQAMREASAATLNALLDRDANATVPPPRLPAFPARVPTLDSIVALGAAERPMVQAAARELDAASAGERLARREIWPDLAVGLQYGQRRGDMGTERMGSLMLGASIPIFAKARQLRMREEAAAMRQMAAADLAAMRADTRGRIATAYADLQRARRLQTLYRGTVLPQAEATVASAMSAYRVGGVDFMTLLDDQMTVNRYRQELAALEADEGTAWAELEMLVGRSLLDADAVAQAASAAADGSTTGGTPR